MICYQNFLKFTKGWYKEVQTNGELQSEIQSQTSFTELSVYVY